MASKSAIQTISGVLDTKKQTPSFDFLAAQAIAKARGFKTEEEPHEPEPEGQPDAEREQETAPPDAGIQPLTTATGEVAVEPDAAEPENEIRTGKKPKATSQEEAEEDKPRMPRKTLKARRQVRQTDDMADEKDNSPLETTNVTAPEMETADIPVCTDNGKGTPFSMLGDKLAQKAKAAATVPVQIAQEPEAKLPATQIALTELADDADLLAALGQYEAGHAAEAEASAEVEQETAQPPADAAGEPDKEPLADDGTPEDVTKEDQKEETPPATPKDDDTATETPTVEAAKETEPKQETVEVAVTGPTAKVSRVAVVIAETKAKAAVKSKAAAEEKAAAAEENAWFNQEDARKLLTALEELTVEPANENATTPPAVTPFVRQWPKRDPNRPAPVRNASPLNIKF